MNSFPIKAPLTVNWALNNTCNFSCRHCYSRSDPGEELSLDVLRGCISRVAEAGVMAVNFGGGEPLLRPDLLQIARHAADSGLRVSMNSNGYLLDHSTAKELARAGFVKIGISIDSHLPELHDRFRGVPGSQQHAVAALGHLKAAGIKTAISTVICTFNHKAVAELVAFALGCGASQLNFHNFKCSGLGMTNRDELDLPPEQWREFYEQALAYKNRYPELDISFDDPIIASLGLKSEKSIVKGSVCGKLSLNFKSNGDITPCGFIPIVIGNIVRDDLRVLWQSSPVLEQLRHKKPTGKCASCSDYGECLGGCSARALALTGDFSNPDPHCWVPDEQDR